MSDAYDHVARGKLQLKTDSSKISKKKKKKDKKNREKLELELEQEKQNNTTQASARQMTKAEQSFKKMQEKMQEKRIMEKASLTHKQRVERFNEHLDNLTEHFDIPKVSWTK